MKLTSVDWAVVAMFFLFNIAVSAWFRRRSEKSVTDFFAAGRNVPWWLAGTSMVAATFAVDTPMAISGLVAKGGIAGAWLIWNTVAGGMLTTFFFARYWRRTGVITDAEIAELRYSGRRAAFLRGFRALYFGLPINCLVLGWVNLAMLKTLVLVLGVSKLEGLAILLGLMALTALIPILSGLWGVLATGFFQFALKAGMAIVLAVFAVRAVGGIDGLKAKAALVDYLRFRQPGATLSFLPGLHSSWMPLLAFLVYVSVNWWAAWYPGAEAGGGGYIAQRMLSARDEQHSLLASLWFNLAHFILQPWPWILVALASLVLYPALGDPEAGYILVMMDHLPAALRGLMFAAIAAAYMSALATQLNWGASYMVNDFYRRFLRKDASEAHYISVARWGTVLITVLSAVSCLFMHSVAGAWQLLLVTGAGTGGVFLLRWYWWRVNAWSEISAMLAAPLVSLTLQFVWRLDPAEPAQFAWLMLITTGLTTAAWLAVTWLTAPEPADTLVAFYYLVRPLQFGWKPMARLVPEVAPAADGWRNLRAWFCGCVLIYGALFGIGKLLLGEALTGVLWLMVGLLAGIIMARQIVQQPVDELEAVARYNGAEEPLSRASNGNKRDVSR